MGQKYATDRHGVITDYYEIKEKLGSGSFATVRKAISKETKEVVAVKIIKKKRLSTKELKSIEREIDIMIKLKHRNVVTLLDVFDSPKQIYLVMELCVGGELFDKVVEAGNYSEHLASKAIKQVCRGIKYLHANGIIHRDLKPENLLYYDNSSEGLLKITDFGLATHLDDPNDLMRTTCGTLHYVAPEVLLGHPYGKEVDLWSLGVILFVLLSGYLPFYADQKKQTYKLIVTGDYGGFDDPVWDGISRDAKDLVKKLLDINPKARITLDEVMKHPWIARAESVASPKTFSVSFATKLKEFNEKRKEDDVWLPGEGEKLAQAVKAKSKKKAAAAAAAPGGGASEEAGDPAGTGKRHSEELQYCPTDHILPDIGDDEANIEVPIESAVSFAPVDDIYDGEEIVDEEKKEE